MSLFKRVRAAGTRRAGLALGGLLTVGLAAVTGTALASSSAPASSAGMAGMTSMVSSSSHGGTGFTNGWYDGHTVRFFYSKNYFCRQPPASGADVRRITVPPVPLVTSQRPLVAWFWSWTKSSATVNPVPGSFWIAWTG